EIRAIALATETPQTQRGRREKRRLHRFLLLSLCVSVSLWQDLCPKVACFDLAEGRKMKIVLLGLICAIAGIGTAAAQAPAKVDRETQKRTLILYTLRKDLPFTSVLERVYQKTLSDGLAGRLDYYAEYIDVARFPEPGYQ